MATLWRPQDAMDQAIRNRKTRGASRVAAEPLLVRLIGGSGVDRIAYHTVRRPDELRVVLNCPNRFGNDSNFRLFVFHKYHPFFFVELAFS